MTIEYSSNAFNAVDSTLNPSISNFTSSGTNPVLIVVCGAETATNLTAVNWNTTESFTQLGSTVTNGLNSISIWYLAGPTATTANITTSSTDPISGVLAVLLYTGVDQTTPFRTAANSSNTGTDTSPTTDVVALNTEMVVAGVWQKVAGGPTFTATHTERLQETSLGAGPDGTLAVQEKASSGATETMSWSSTSGNPWMVMSGAMQADITIQGFPGS